MEPSSFRIKPKASISLNSILDRQSKSLPAVGASLSAGLDAACDRTVGKTDFVSVVAEVNDPERLLAEWTPARPGEQLVRLGDTFLSAYLTLSSVRKLLSNPAVIKIQSKKLARFHLDAVGIRSDLSLPAGARIVPQTGNGVLIGIVDSGFDLSHPMFRNATGDGLRVDGLLDQTAETPREFTHDQLVAGWNDETQPGRDEIGHGTHVASIAGGGSWKGMEGVAPQARFVLVKTNLIDTDEAVSWVFKKAAEIGKPCVVNLSQGHHWGAHDGTSAEERLYGQISGPGKIIVASAGNEAEDNLHLGGRFVPADDRTVTFDILKGTATKPAHATLTIWYDERDDFALTVFDPFGQALPVPNLGKTDRFEHTSYQIELSRRAYTASRLVQIQIELSFLSLTCPASDRKGWKLNINCRSAVIGRMDAWFANSGSARFRANALVEPARTIGIPATSAACLTVASFVSKTSWKADDGAQSDADVLEGRLSPFSSQGPTRDGRQKPDISAAGQYVTAALATSSELAAQGDRTIKDDRLLTIEGTSMAAPVVTGAIALLLEMKPTLTPDEVRKILADSAGHDAHVPTIGWNPAYGHGKLDIEKALAQIP